MRHSKWVFALGATLLALGTASFFGGATTSTARGQDVGGAICGTIASTVVITRDAWLACDVDCTEVDTPCIEFGKPGIKFSLNGFKLTGPANPQADPSGCVTTANFLPADGIRSIHDDVQIEGPGLVQRMRRHGIALFGPPGFVDKAQVKKLTSHQNCFSGIWLVAVRESLIDEVVSVKNSGASSVFPCGGTCITNSHNNVIRRSEFAGNGSTVTGPGGPCPVAVPNDFGVGLVGNSSGNLIEENGMGGNINGLFICGTAAAPPVGNLIKKNVIAGNPPIQVSASSGADVGYDIHDFSPAGSNKFEENLCITYTGPSPPPCPNIPKYAGHQNN